MRRALWVLLLVPPVGACALDWGSLEQDGGGLLDATEDVMGFPDVRVDTGRDVQTDVAPQDSADESDGTTPDASDDTTGDETSSEAGQDAGNDVEDAGSETGTDATTFDASDGGADASDASADAPVEADAGCPDTITGTLAIYDLSSLSGISTSAPATSTATGITAAAITRSSILKPESASGAINSSNWSLGTLDSTRYYTFTITPPAMCTMAITGVYLDTASSLTGPANGDVATSADSFTSTSSFTPGSAGTVTVSVTGAMGAIEVRVYGYNATASGGTMRIENTMTVSGSLK
jgi:hypothetical protein